MRPQLQGFGVQSYSDNAGQPYKVLQLGTSTELSFVRQKRPDFRMTPRVPFSKLLWLLPRRVALSSSTLVKGMEGCVELLEVKITALSLRDLDPHS